MSRKKGPVSLHSQGVQRIAIDQIDFNPYNVYGILKDPDFLGWLGRSFSGSQRYINPPIVCPKRGEPGRYLCIAGEGRIIAASKYVDEIPCYVWEEMDAHRAMRVLAEDNATQAMRVPLARANEAYWLYRVILVDSQDHETAMEYVRVTYHSRQHVYEKLIVPGWLLAPTHSRVITELMDRAGPRREHLQSIQREQAQLLLMKQIQMYALALPFWPVFYKDLLQAPPREEQAEFDALLRYCLDQELMGLEGPEFMRAIRDRLRKAMEGRAERLIERAMQTEDVTVRRAIAWRIGTLARKKDF